MDYKTGEKIKLDEENYFDQIAAHNQMVIDKYRTPIVYFKAILSLEVDEIWDKYYKGGSSSRVLSL